MSILLPVAYARLRSSSYDLTKQQRKIANYIYHHKECTTKDIQRDTGITCPSGRITELRNAGIAIKSIGRKRYPGSRAFEMYAIQLPNPIELPKLTAMALNATPAVPASTAIPAATTEQKDDQNNDKDHFHLRLQCSEANVLDGRKVPSEVPGAITIQYAQSSVVPEWVLCGFSSFRPYYRVDLN